MDPTTNENDVLGSTPGPEEPSGERSDLMNPATRDRLLTLLAAVGRELPSMRLGQLICALTSSADAAVPDSIYDVEDDELIASAEAQLAYLREHR